MLDNRTARAGSGAVRFCGAVVFFFGGGTRLSNAVIGTIALPFLMFILRLLYFITFYSINLFHL
jgi:hypothetical protein